MSTHPFVILYVEDNDYIREAFAELLARPERQIVPVADGASARAALRAQNIHLLMTDLNLPDGSGIDVARDARRQNPQLPVIVCSGYGVTDIAGALGPAAHALQKPIDLDELDGLIEQYAR